MTGLSTADPLISLDPGLAGHFAEIADGRVLVIDHLITRPAGGLPVGELSARFQRTPPHGSVTLTVIEGVPCVVDPRLVGVLRAARPRLLPVMDAILGHLAIELALPFAWLDYVSSSPSRRD